MTTPYDKKSRVVKENDFVWHKGATWQVSKISGKKLTVKRNGFTEVVESWKVEKK